MGNPSIDELQTQIQYLLVERLKLAEEQALLLGQERAARAEAEAAQRRLETVLEQLPVGVLIVEAPSEAIVLRNARAQEILHLPSSPAAQEDALSGRRMLHSDGTPYGDDEHPLARTLRLGEVVTEEELEYVRPDGVSVLLAINAAPIRSVEGSIVAGVLTIDDITLERRAERELRKALERYRLVSRATNDTIWEWDLVTGEGSWNEGIQTMFGYSPEAVETSNTWWAERVHPDDRVRVLEGVNGAIRNGGDSWTGEYRFRRADGSYVTVLDRAYIARTADGVPLRVVGSMLDITERKRAEQEREELLAREQRARLEAEEANQAKATFLAIMSHELRTPLNAILGYGELLSEEIVGTLNAAQQDQLARIRASAHHLVELIDQVLSFARVEAGRDEMHPVEVDVFRLARDAAALVEPQALKKGLALSLRLSDHPFPIRTDAGKLRQILLNLLSNAVKFTDVGGVELSVDTSGDGLVRFQVRDTGIGISAEQSARIFEPFTQVDQSSTRRAGGTGLGLAVSQQLAKLLGGDIQVRSVLGEGSIFTLRLPHAPTAAEPGPQPVTRTETR